MIRKVHIAVQNDRFRLPAGDITLFADLILKKYRPNNGWHITIVFGNDAQIIALNQKYFNKPDVTDVISFNLDGEHADILQGEIYIDVDQAYSQARRLKVTTYNEILRLIGHGILHLLGYKDTTEKERIVMTQQENELLAEYMRFGRR